MVIKHGYCDDTEVFEQLRLLYKNFLQMVKADAHICYLIVNYLFIEQVITF